MCGRSLAVPLENSFAFHVPLAPGFFSRLWIGGRSKTLPDAAIGDSFLFDLSDNPIVELNTPFDSMRFYIPQASLDALAQDHGIRRVNGLHAPSFSRRDPVVHGLAQSLAAAMSEPNAGATMLADYISLAFFAHVVHVYGGASVALKRNRRGLAPWQERRAKDLIDSRLGSDLSLHELALECGLSIAHFSRAFRQSVGVPPHKWLMRRRVDAAQQFLANTETSLAQIAADCGFADQAHFTNVFTGMIGAPPGAFRRKERKTQTDAGSDRGNSDGFN
jgi:AraC-like DNA-binding protein